jgi:hypothetical protein
MKFNEYEEDQTLTLLDISKLGFKGGASDILLNNILATDLYRSAMVATQRGGFAGMQINGVCSSLRAEVPRDNNLKFVEYGTDFTKCSKIPLRANS